MALVIK